MIQEICDVPMAYSVPDANQQLFPTGASPNPGLATLLGEPSQRRRQLHKGPSGHYVPRDLQSLQVILSVLTFNME